MIIRRPLIINIGISQYKKLNKLALCKMDIIALNSIWNKRKYTTIFDNLNEPY